MREDHAQLCRAQDLASVATPGQMDEFIEPLVGLMTLVADTTTIQGTSAPEGPEADAKRYIAGAQYVPCHIRAAFWGRFTRAA